MIEEIKRKKIDKQDKFLPQSFEQLIQMYDLEELWSYLDTIVGNINNEVSPEIENIGNKISKTENYIVAGISTDRTLNAADTYFNLNLNTTISSNGNLLSLENGSVKIGSGINEVEVSGAIYITTIGTTGVKRAVIKKNGNTNLARSIRRVEGSYESIQIAPVIVKVEEGDFINLQASSYQGTTTVIGSDSTITKLVVKVIS